MFYRTWCNVFENRLFAKYFKDSYTNWTRGKGKMSGGFGVDEDIENEDEEYHKQHQFQWYA